MSDNSRFFNQPSGSNDDSVRKPKFDACRYGEVAELAFVLKATSLGFNPSRPYGARLPYDFLLDCGSRVLRIQVKSVFINRPGYQNRFYANVCQHNLNGSVAYNVADIDFIVVYVAPFDTWYVLPVKVLLGRKGIYVYPDGKRRRRDAGMYEDYREAWHLLHDDPTPTLSSRPKPSR